MLDDIRTDTLFFDSVLKIQIQIALYQFSNFLRKTDCSRMMEISSALFRNYFVRNHLTRDFALYDNLKLDSIEERVPI